MTTQIASEEAITTEFRAACFELAAMRYENAPPFYEIYWFPDAAEETIRFIDIDAETIPTGEAMIFAFGRSKGFPYRNEVAQVTPEEWEKIKSHEIPLPDGWLVEAAQHIPRQ